MHGDTFDLHGVAFGLHADTFDLHEDASRLHPLAFGRHQCPAKRHASPSRRITCPARRFGLLPGCTRPRRGSTGLGRVGSPRSRIYHGHAYIRKGRAPRVPCGPGRSHCEDVKRPKQSRSIVGNEQLRVIERALRAAQGKL
jgi:hypothetical protein